MHLPIQVPPWPLLGGPLKIYNPFTTNEAVPASLPAYNPPTHQANLVHLNPGGGGQPATWYPWEAEDLKELKKAVWGMIQTPCGQIPFYRLSLQTFHHSRLASAVQGGPAKQYVYQVVETLH